MKPWIACFLAFVTVAGFAATTLEIPLTVYYFEKNKEVKVSLKKLNEQLKQKGLAGLPEIVVVGSNPEAYWKLLEKRAQAAREAFGHDYIFNLMDQGYGENYLYKISMCYRGKVTDVPELLESMLGNFLNQEQGLLAIAAGKKRVIHDDAFRTEAGVKERYQEDYSIHKKELDRWFNYPTKSRTALVLSDYGAQGDGTELEVSEIKPCK